MKQRQKHIHTHTINLNRQYTNTECSKMWVCQFDGLTCLMNSICVYEWIGIYFDSKIVTLLFSARHLKHLTPLKLVSERASVCVVSMSNSQSHRCHNYNHFWFLAKHENRIKFKLISNSLSKLPSIASQLNGINSGGKMLRAQHESSALFIRKNVAHPIPSLSWQLWFKLYSLNR